jgi:hypothetical protein
MSSESSMDRRDKVILDFWLLISMPVACLKSRIPSLIFSISCLVPSQKINMSSTNIRCEMYSPVDIFMPLKVPASFASIKKRLRHSVTRRKRSGDKGHPCLTPRSIVKKEEADPLINIEKDTEVKQAIVQFVKATPKPRCISNIRI